MVQAKKRGQWREGVNTTYQANTLPFLQDYQRDLQLQAGPNHCFPHDCPWPSPVTSFLTKWKSWLFISPCSHAKPWRQHKIYMIALPLIPTLSKLQWHKFSFMHIDLLCGKFVEVRGYVSRLLLARNYLINITILRMMMMMIEQMSHINNKNYFKPEIVLEMIVEMSQNKEVWYKLLHSQHTEPKRR